MLVPLRQEKRYIVRQKLLYLDKMQDENMLQWVCVQNIHHNMKELSYPGDLKQVMHVGNQLRSSLLQLVR